MDADSEVDGNDAAGQQHASGIGPDLGRQDGLDQGWQHPGSCTSRSPNWNLD